MRGLKANLPNAPSSAGINVMAPSTATTTARPAEIPICVMKGMPTTLSAHTAITTVRPANTTAEPAVPTALPAAASRDPPRFSSDRYLDTMNSA
ncbi:Uncharacterised protein [Mycobacteroides abscessus subsp. abscessus]|nr:Uncharacterised protein [Mycobacteroides abscessus subsp. abscessus]